MERDLTTTEAAAMLGVNRFTVRRWCQKRRLPSYFISDAQLRSKDRRIRAADVAKFAEKQRKGIT
jgi:excisionase family DNA binding protein